MKAFIKDLKIGDKIESVYLLKTKEIQKTKENKPYLRLVICDKTGSLEGRMWENVEAADAKIESGTAVLVRGAVDSWKNNVQVRVDDIRSASGEEYKTDELVRVVENAGQIFEEIKKYLEGLSNEWIKLLAKEFLKDEELMDKFKKSPGARSWHNAYIGGLLEHTHHVMCIADRMCDLCPEANRDIALFGAFSHDIGKTFEIDPATFEYTVAGGLVGHLPIGFELVSGKISKIQDFPQDLALHLKHIVLSHHGEYQQQSPVLPKTLEATIVYHADDLVSQTNAVSEIMRTQSGIQKTWSNYISIKERQYLLIRPKDITGAKLE